MGNHEQQLELFDLQPYTSPQPTAMDSKKEQVEKIRQFIHCEQLELKLFPQQSYKTLSDLVRLAA